MTRPDSTFINVKTDFGFKKLFGTEENKNLLVRFLNALLGDVINVEGVEFHDKEMLPDDPSGKRIIYDVYFTSKVKGYVDPVFGSRHRDFQDEESDDGRLHHFTLEMQNEYEPPFEERVAYYASRLIADQGSVGWNYSLEPVIAVVVTDFDFTHLAKKVVHQIMLCDSENGEALTEKIKIFLLSLSQIGKKRWEECVKELDKILFLIKNMDKLDKNSEPYKSFEYEDFFNAADSASMVNEDCVAYSQSLQRYNDIKAGIEYASRKSREEGLKEGIEKGIEKEMARSVRMMESFGIPLDKIAENYGLSVDKIKDILN